MARHGFPMPRGGGQDLPRGGSPSPHVPTNGGPPSTDGQPEKHPFGEGIPTRRTSERICPAQEHAPRRKPPDTAHERKDLPRARRLSSAKASRHGARAKGFVPRRNTPLGEGLPTRRTSERICPTRERSPRRRPPDTARERKDLPARERSPRRRPSDTAHERRDLPTRERSPRRKPPDTAHERKGLPRARTLSSAKASRHGARAKEFAPRGSRSPHVPTNGGPPSVHRQPKNTPSAGSHPQRAAAAEFIHLKK